MIVRRFALGTALASTALAIVGCGMMNSSAPTTPTMTAPTPPAAPTMPAMPAMVKPAMLGNAMTATLSASNEVPPNTSSATGSAMIKLDGDMLSWSISYSGMTGPVTGAHFHGPAAAGANAGVVLPFAGSLASPIVGSKQLTPAQIVDLKSGKWYVNLHTAANPGGEVRGQVQ